jgi:hypothetical protein
VPAEALALALDAAPLLDATLLEAVDYAVKVGRAATRLEREGVERAHGT